MTMTKTITQELIENFKDYLINEEKSTATLDNYMRDIAIGTISKITTLDYNSSLNIELVPIIDFARLENVVVVNQKELNDRKAYKE